MEYCRYCSQRLRDGINGTHPACAAEWRRRAGDGECLWCGSPKCVDGMHWCAACRDSPDREYAGYGGAV